MTYPALRALGVDDRDLARLARQGFVAGEVRSGRRYFKLRFRRDDRQVVMFIGSDESRVQAIRLELAELQRARRQSKAMAVLGRRIRKAFRGHCVRSAPIMQSAGYHFHGYIVRKRRGAGTAGDAKHAGSETV